MSGPRVLVIGGGHAGLAAAHGVLARMSGAHVVLFEPRDKHLLKPRLAEAIDDEVEVELPLEPFVDLPRLQRVRALVDTVDPGAVRVEADGKTWDGDYVIIACGGRTRVFNGATKSKRKKAAATTKRTAPAKRKGAAPTTFVLDSRADATKLREHIEDQVERAAGKVTPARRRALLSVLVIGGGYTGVEAAPSIAVLMRRLALKAGISPALVHVTLAESRERLFAGVPDEELAKRVDEALARKAVDVRTGETVRLEGGVPIFGRHPSDASTVLLATGIEGAIPLASGARGRSSRWEVDEALRVIGHPAAFAVGDAAIVTAGKSAVAASAQHAVQAGSHAAAMIECLVSGKALRPFQPSTVGEFLTLGEGEVIGWVQFAGRRLHLSGFSAAAARTAAFARYLAGLKIGALRASRS